MPARMEALFLLENKVKQGNRPGNIESKRCYSPSLAGLSTALSYQVTHAHARHRNGESRSPAAWC